MSRFVLLLETVSNLSPSQIAFRIWYSIKRFIIPNFKIKPIKRSRNFTIKDSKIFNVSCHIENIEEFKLKFSEDSFEFNLLNTSITFINEIEWNADYLNNGTRLLKLQLHNQKYLIPLALCRTDLNKHIVITVIRSWIKFNNYINRESYKGPWNSYCASNRIISYLIIDAIPSINLNGHISNFSSIVFSHYKHIKRNLELDIKGNHLLENYIALCFCSVYLENKKEFKKNYNSLLRVLEDQILDDGAHYELSTMYHSVILKKLLDVSNYIISNQYHLEIELQKLEKHCYKMIRWYDSIQLNSYTPLLNDSVESEIVPLNQIIKSYQLLYKKKINLKKEYSLKESGIRKFSNPRYNLLIKIGDIGAKEVPGHAHADTFNTLLSNKDGMIFIDPGVSTYNNNKTRNFERSTECHNTVSITGLNSSRIWSSFRVGTQCKTEILDENQTFCSAKHDGFKKIGVWHNREWYCKDSKIIIVDNLNNNSRRVKGLQNWILHPDKNPIIEGNAIIIDELKMKVYGNQTQIDIHEIKIPIDYNKTTFTNRIQVSFSESLTTEIEFN